MSRTAYLRVYQPVSAFAPEDRAAWEPAGLDDDVEQHSDAHRWLIRSALPDADVAPTEGAFVKKVGDVTLVCPWRTRLRMLAGLLAFRGSIPDEVADAFVPADEAHRAARELAQFEENHPEVRSHIIHANWHVPLRWFVPFHDTERILVEDRNGLRLRYEIPLAVAFERLDRALVVLEGSMIDEEVTEAVRELRGWLGEFGEVGLLELDYGSVASSFSDEELLEDRSAAEVQDCIDALEQGDLVRAGRTFTMLTDRWTGARAREIVN